VSRGSKKRWGQLSQRERRAVVGGGVVQLILLAGALADLRRRRPQEINGPKRLWMAISLVNFVGPIAYFAFGRKR